MKAAKKSVMIFEAPERLKEKAHIYSKEGMMSVSAMCRVALDEWIDAQVERRKISPLQSATG